MSIRVGMGFDVHRFAAGPPLVLGGVEIDAPGLLGHSDADAAHETASRLGDLIAGSDFSHSGHTLPLSVAIGAATIEADDTPETAMARADQEMYRRKAAA